MKKRFKKTVSLLLAVILFLGIGVQTSFASSGSAASALPQIDVLLYNVANVLIDVIHRCVTLYRYPWQPKSDNKLDLSKFTLTFDDEFDGNTLNTAVWQNYADAVREGGYWDEDQAFVKNGNLIIRTEYKADGRFGPGYYSRRVDTRGRFEQTFGYFECRCILPAAQGLWSAFWLSSTQLGDNVPGEKGTEIDVFESPLYYRKSLGLNNDLVTTNIHYGGYKLGHRYANVAVTKVSDPYTQYHTYGVEWNEKEYIFYIDGAEIGRSSFGGVSKVPEFMELSTEVDGAGGVPSHGWSGLITQNQSGALPADFVVDYVRVYQYNNLMK